MTVGEAHATVSRLLNATRVAIVGASANRDKPSGLLFENIRNSGWSGALFPVNPRYQELDGVPVFPSVHELPSEVDLAVVAVGPDQAAAAVEDCASHGIPTILLLSGGFGEGATGQVGLDRARDLLATCRRHGTRLVGPNSVGIVNFDSPLPLTFADWYRSDTGVRGSTAIITQSGSVGGLAFRHLQNQGVGIRYWVGAGNELDLGIEDFLAAWLDDPTVSRVVCYLEGVRDGRAYLRAAKNLTSAGKHLVVLKAVDTSAARRAAVSHTGKLASSQAMYDAAFRSVGAITVTSLQELAYVLRILADSPQVPRGRRIGIFSASGGICALAASHAESAGLEVPRLNAEAARALSSVVPNYGSWDNPIDLSADVIAKPDILAGALASVQLDPTIDTWVGIGRPILDRYQDMLLAHASSATTPLVLCSGLGDGAGRLATEKARGLATLEDVEITMRAIARIVAAGERPSWVDDASAAATTDRATSTVGLEALQRSLIDRGVAFPQTWLAEDLDSVRELLPSIDGYYPVAVKSGSDLIPHKTEAGCVRIGVSDSADLLTASTEVLAAADRAMPGGAMAGVQIQTMVSPGVEMLVSVYRDSDFGAVLLVGAGGITTELTMDVQLRLLPTTDGAIEEMLTHLRVDPLLRGYRGAPPADVPALVTLIGALAAWYLTSPDATGIELNPVIVGPEGQGATAVDIAHVRAAAVDA